MAEETQSPNGVQATSVAAPAVIGVGTVTVTGEPTAWVWNELFNWAVGGGLPMMPLPVAQFFGGLLIAACYGVYRMIQARRQAS